MAHYTSSEALAVWASRNKSQVHAMTAVHCMHLHLCVKPNCLTRTCYCSVDEHLHRHCTQCRDFISVRLQFQYKHLGAAVSYMLTILLAALVISTAVAITSAAAEMLS
jgi:hypothetical protein